MARAIICLVAAALLNGCARPTEAQQTAIRTGTNVKEARAAMTACIAETRNEPKYAPIISHYPNIETGQYSIEQLSNKNIPSPAEGKLVALMYDYAGVCRNLFDKSIQENRPDLSSLLEQSRNSVSAITIELAQSKISWGEAAQKFQALKADMDVQVATVNREWVSDLKASNDAEMADRRANAAIAMQYMANQQAIYQQQTAAQQQNLNQQLMINAINRPVTTNCFASGPLVNCTSQ